MGAREELRKTRTGKMKNAAASEDTTAPHASLGEGLCKGNGRLAAAAHGTTHETEAAQHHRP